MIYRGVVSSLQQRVVVDRHTFKRLTCDFYKCFVHNSSTEHSCKHDSQGCKKKKALLRFHRGQDSLFCRTFRPGFEPKPQMNMSMSFFCPNKATVFLIKYVS